MYQLHIMHGASNTSKSDALMLFSRLETAIATAMALPPSQRATIESWNGPAGKWVRQMERTAEHCQPEGGKLRKIPPTLRFCRDEAGCTHFAPPGHLGVDYRFDPYDGVPADTGSV